MQKISNRSVYYPRKETDSPLKWVDEYKKAQEHKFSGNYKCNH